MLLLPPADPPASAGPAPAAVSLPVLAPVYLPLAPLPSVDEGGALAAIAHPWAPVPGGSAGGAGAVGGGLGPGMGGAADYIFVASPRTAILPPLAEVPGSVTGRTYRVRFWVAADGHVTRVEVDPPIPDGVYRRQFLERMLGYAFDPARTRDGMQVASVVSVFLRIGN